MLRVSIDVGADGEVLTHGMGGVLGDSSIANRRSYDTHGSLSAPMNLVWLYIDPEGGLLLLSKHARYFIFHISLLNAR